MIYTTLNKIREHDPCPDGWKKLLAGLNKAEPDDELLPLVRILEINGLDDALWALRTTDCDRESRLLAVAYARQVQHLMKDERSVAALDVAERFANGKATREELIESRVAADAAAKDEWAAARAAANAAYAARAAAHAARAAVNDANDAVLAAEWAAEWAAARVAADAAAKDEWAAARAADTAVWATVNAVDAVLAAEWAAAWAAAMREKQVELFKEMLG